MGSKKLSAIDLNPFSPEAQSIEQTKRLSSEDDRKKVHGTVKALKENGYVILKSRLTKEKLGKIRTELKSLHEEVSKGTSHFGGFETERVYNLVARTRVLDELYLRPELLAIIESHLNDQIQLSISSSVNLLPGQPAQSFHRDDAYYPLPRPHMPLSVNTMWAIDDFTEENGATLLIPNSHVSASDEPVSGHETVKALMPAGSVMIWDGSLFHAGGHNRTSNSRMGITVVYCRAWLRQQENQFLGVPPALAKNLTRPLQKLIGYWVANNFLGYLNEASPSVLLRAQEKD